MNANGICNNSLPSMSFVAFETNKLKGTEIVWLNKDLVNKYWNNESIDNFEKTLLDNYSYVSDGYTKKNKVVHDDKKIFLADRYGSRHEVCNGGSARCGFDGIFQIKGLGCTPLLAQNMCKTHSNGKLFLDEAIFEAIWGELCHKHLPFGSIRTLAIIKTNVQEEFLYLNERPLRQCALVIREFPVRPAHFERAAFFWPSSKYMALRDNDADRVRESMNFLPLCLDEINVNFNSRDNLIEALSIIFFRMAKQIAYSRVKGIPHGSLTSSNISIDGRFLDFGTITAVPDFGNYLLANGVGAVWDDHLLVVKWLRNFLINIKTYSNFELSYRDIEHLLYHFSTEIRNQENIALLDELGIVDKSERNLITAGEIKNSLIKARRKKLGDFRSNEFIDEVCSLSRDKGLKIGDLKFELRCFKFSSFNIMSHVNMDECEHSKESITNLISQYC